MTTESKSEQIRNKLQLAKTVIEAMLAGKKPTEQQLRSALKGLEEAIKEREGVIE